jgi:hypothetical protein
VTIDSIHFRYPLTGALIMDYFDDGEFKIWNKRIVPSFRMNGKMPHDLIAEKIMNSGRKRRISTWVNRLTNKSRTIFKAIIENLEVQNIVRIEHRKFLNLIPYQRYWFIDTRIRTEIIEILRNILLYGKQPGKKEYMLLGIVEASRAYKLLAKERGEASILRKKNLALLKGDVISAEISQAIREVQAATVASVTSATMAAYSSH